MRYSPLLMALAACLPLACSNGGSGGTTSSGVCGGSQAACASLTDCCTGFECQLGKCLFVGSGIGGQNGGTTSGVAGGTSNGGSNIGGSSGGNIAGGTTGRGTSGGNIAGGTTGRGTSGSGTTGFAGTTGSSSGYSPDLCALCDSLVCAGANDLCVCDPKDVSCTDYYCAGSCGTGNQALCPTGTTCLAAMNPQSGGEDYVCYPAKGTCLPSVGGTSGGSTSGTTGGTAGDAGFSPDMCYPCGNSTNCTGASDVCVCDPDDPSCTNGYCAGNCANNGVADPALCPRNGLCVSTLLWTDDATQEYVCYPADGTCLDAGVG